jgi:protein-tyrosine phosphatase
MLSLYKLYCYTYVLLNKTAYYIKSHNKETNVMRLKDKENTMIQNLYDLSYPMSKIIDGIYLGNACNSRDYYNLKDKNIKSIVNCTVEFPNYFPDEFNYYNVPILDESRQKITDYLNETTKFIHDNIENGNVLVHCFMGASRSVAIVVAYLVRYHNFTVEEAIAKIDSIRNIVNINMDFYIDLINFQFSKI